MKGRAFNIRDLTVSILTAGIGTQPEKLDEQVSLIEFS